MASFDIFLNFPRITAMVLTKRKISDKLVAYVDTATNNCKQATKRNPLSHQHPPGGFWGFVISFPVKSIWQIIKIFMLTGN